MSAIAGIIGKTPDFNAAKAMNGLLRRREESDFGEFFSNDEGQAVLLLHNGRANNKSRQTSALQKNDSALALVLTGRINNSTDLHAKLADVGCKIEAKSDHQIIIELYRKYGTDAFAELAGAFALALYDRAQQKVFLVRDRLGQKELCYFQANGGVVFASLIGALKRHPDFPAEINNDALKHYLAYQSFALGSGFYCGVRKLMPGHYLECDLTDGTATAKCFKKIDFTPVFCGGFDAAANKLRDLLQNAVARSLPYDVPIGALLSGGIDSAIIAALLAQSEMGKNVSFFTAVLPGKGYDESADARASAKFIGKEKEHHFVPVDLSNFELIKQLFDYYGEPLGDASVLPSSLIMAAAGKYSGIIFSGDGADELFGGYERYRLMELARRIDRYGLGRLFAGLAKITPGTSESRTKLFRLKRALRILGTSPELRYSRIFAKSDDADCLENWSVFDAREAMKHDMAHYLAEDIFPKNSIASMFNGVEIASPFFDDEVVDFAAGLPTEYVVDSYRRKKLLKCAFGDLLPPEIWERPKRGFGVPLGNLLRNEWREDAEKLLFNTSSSGKGNPAKLRQYWDEHQKFRCDRGEYIWNELILALLYNSDSGKM